MADDLVHEALARALDPNGDPWRPEVEPELARHLMRIMDNLHRGEQDKALIRRDPRHVVAVNERTLSPSETPEDLALRKEQDTQAMQRLAALKERIADDELALAIVDLARDHRFERPAEQAEATGRTIDEIRNARKRVKRAVEALIDEERATAVLEEERIFS